MKELRRKNYEEAARTLGCKNIVMDFIGDLMRSNAPSDDIFEYYFGDVILGTWSFEMHFCRRIGNKEDEERNREKQLIALEEERAKLQAKIHEINREIAKLM